MGDIQPDPSMEEILASIKRVIAEDNGSAASTRAPRRPTRLDPLLDEDVLELDDPVPELSALLSDDAASASRERLAALSALRQQEDGHPLAGAGALDAVVREMLKPMLKDWLYRHLPEIVEELVSREVARITGREP